MSNSDIPIGSPTDLSAPPMKPQRISVITLADYALNWTAGDSEAINYAVLQAISLWSSAGTIELEKVSNVFTYVQVTTYRYLPSVQSSLMRFNLYVQSRYVRK